MASEPERFVAVDWDGEVTAGTTSVLPAKCHLMSVSRLPIHVSHNSFHPGTAVHSLGPGENPLPKRIKKLAELAVQLQLAVGVIRGTTAHCRCGRSQLGEIPSSAHCGR